MLYTPVPYEDIFSEEAIGRDLADHWYWQEVRGRLCLIRTGPDGRPRLERMLSPEARDYLDGYFEPGRYL